MLKHLNNKRGLTLINLVVVVTLSVSLLVLTGGTIFEANKDRKETEIDSNISILTSVGKTFFSANNNYPTINNKPLSSFTDGTSLKEFHDILVAKLGATNAELDNRVKLIDFQTLYTDKYLTSTIENQDEYVTDTNTGKVYHVAKDSSPKDLLAIAEQLIKDANEVTNLSLGDDDQIQITVDGKTMTKMNVSASEGKKLFIGGGNDGYSTTDIKLALVEFEDVDSETVSKITDLTPKVKGGTLDKPITDLRILDSKTLLVHYYNTTNSALSYEVIEY